MRLKGAQSIFTEIGQWIFELGIPPLKVCYVNLRRGWNTLKNHFEHRVTNAIAEGINNVIKMIKRRSLGFRNKEYFRLKITQICGFLNSNYSKTHSFPERRHAIRF